MVLEKITLQINGLEVQAEEGQTLLQVARSIGVFIPTLCHHEALLPFGACRLCLVEVEKEGRRKTEAACSYPAEREIAVFTETPEIMGVRKMAAAMLLSRCPQVPLIRKIATMLGAEDNLLPLQGSEAEECILCGRCVRVCREAIGKHAVSFAYRGTERSVTTPFGDHSHDCIGCTACVFVCPTGAIKVTEQGEKKHLDPWNTELSLTNCSACGRSFIPEKVLAHLHEHQAATDSKGSVCPICRRKETAATFAQLKS